MPSSSSTIKRQEGGTPVPQKLPVSLTSVKARVVKSAESGVKLPQFESGIVYSLVWDLSKFLNLSELQGPYFDIPYFLKLLRGLNGINHVKVLSICLTYDMLNMLTIIIMPHHGSALCGNPSRKPRIYMQREECLFSQGLTCKLIIRAAVGKGWKKQGLE